MKYYASYVEYHSIEVELPEDSSSQEVFEAVAEKIDELSSNGQMDRCLVENQIESIIDENDNYIWEI